MFPGLNRVASGHGLGTFKYTGRPSEGAAPGLGLEKLKLSSFWGLALLPSKHITSPCTANSLLQATSVACSHSHIHTCWESKGKATSYLLGYCMCPLPLTDITAEISGCLLLLYAHVFVSHGSNHSVLDPAQMWQASCWVSAQRTQQRTFCKLRALLVQDAVVLYKEVPLSGRAAHF